jgi:hypothetical protein
VCCFSSVAHAHIFLIGPCSSFHAMPATDRLCLHTNARNTRYSNQDNATAEAENERIADELGSTVRLRAIPHGGGPEPTTEFANKPDCVLPSAQCETLSWARSNSTNVVSSLNTFLFRQSIAPCSSMLYSDLT